MSYFQSDFSAIFIAAYVSFFERGRGFPKFKILPISHFSQIRSKWGASNFQFFPNSKKSKTSWGRGGGLRKLWTFSTFGTYMIVGLFEKFAHSRRRQGQTWKGYENENDMKHTNLIKNYQLHIPQKRD